MSAGKLQAFSNATLGFLGLNTQEAGVTLEGGYAAKAVNCIIDKFGRLGSRRGWKLLTTSPGLLTANNYIETIWEFVDASQTSTFISVGNLKFYTGVETLVNLPVVNSGGTEVFPTFIGNRWQFSQLAEGIGFDAFIGAFAVQSGNPMMVYHRLNNTGNFVLQEVGVYGAKPTGVSLFDPDCCVSAYGRMWVAGITGAKSTVYYSKLLDGSTYTGVGSGLLDIATVVGNNDEVIALANHNGYLIIFCRDHIVVYEGAQSPTTMVLKDVIVGVGCIARDTVQNTGTDLIFLSNSGVRSLNRVIQEKSMPMRELSLNVRDDLVQYVNGEDKRQIKSVYFERDAFYLMVLPSLQQCYYFDLRQTLPSGAARVTSWNNFTPKALYATKDRRLLLGKKGGIGNYFGYTDNGASYRLEYFTTSVDVSSPYNLKFLKKASLVVIAAGSQDIIMKYGFDYQTTYTSRTFTKDFIGGSSEYSIAEYNIGEFTSGTAINEIVVHLGGSGKILQFGIEIPIEDSPVSLQQLTVYLKSGKLI
jgi:hypothetical protein